MRSRLARWWVRSPHRVHLTRGLAPVVRGLAGTVLDVGGGQEAPLDIAWSREARRVRIDLTARAGAEVLGDALRLPVRSGSADGIVMCEVLEHVGDPRAALAEAHRALRDGGVLCGSVPFVMGIHANPHDYFRYTGDGLAVLLAGFREVDVRPHGNHVSAAWRLLNLRFRPLLVLNPLVRLLAPGTNDRCPVGYTFVATK